MTCVLLASPLSPGFPLTRGAGYHEATSYQYPGSHNLRLVERKCCYLLVGTGYRGLAYFEVCEM